MGVEMLEKNSFYTFGRKVSQRDANGEFKNFLPVFVAGGVLFGRKKKNDKTRQEIADKYQSLRVDCDGIDSSINRVSNDLSSLKSSKPRKNKDERIWKIRVEETENTLRELESAKRNLICTKAEAPLVPVVVKDNIPSATPSGSSSGASTGSSSSGNILVPPQMGVLDMGTLNGGKYGANTGIGTGISSGAGVSSGSGVSGASETQTSAATPKSKTNMILYIVLGVAALAGLVYVVRKK